MDQSLFARLPAELRLIIYEYALATGLFVSVRALNTRSQQDRRCSEIRLILEPTYHWGEDEDDFFSDCGEESDYRSIVNEDSDVDSGNVSDSDSGSLKTNPLALTSACRQVRREALPVFYAVNGIVLEGNENVHTAFPMLQMMLLSNWLRHIPHAQTGILRHIIISAPDQLFNPDKTIPAQALAQTIYQHYVEFASCFDTGRTQLSLDLGEYMEFSPTRADSLVPTRQVRTRFIMTPWTDLRQRVEAHIQASEARFQKSEADVLRWQWEGESIRRVRKTLEISERDARYVYGVLRHLVGIVEEVEGHTK